MAFVDYAQTLLLCLLFACFPRESTLTNSIKRVVVKDETRFNTNIVFLHHNHKRRIFKTDEKNERTTKKLEHGSLNRRLERGKLSYTVFVPPLNSMLGHTRKRHHSGSQHGSRFKSNGQKRVLTRSETASANISSTSFYVLPGDLKNKSLNKRERVQSNGTRAMSRTEAGPWKKNETKKSRGRELITNESNERGSDGDKIPNRDKRHRRLVGTDGFTRRKTISKGSSDIIHSFQRANEVTGAVTLALNAMNYTTKLKAHNDDKRERNLLYMKRKDKEEKVVDDVREEKAASSLMNDGLMEALNGVPGHSPARNSSGAASRKQNPTRHQASLQAASMTFQNYLNESNSVLSLKHANFINISNPFKSSLSFYPHSPNRIKGHSATPFTVEPDLILHMNVGKGATATVLAYKPPKMQKLLQCCYKDTNKKYDSRGAMYFAVAVILFYGISIALLVAASTLRRSRTDYELKGFLRSYAKIEEEKRTREKQLARTVLQQRNLMHMLPGCEKTSFFNRLVHSETFRRISKSSIDSTIPLASKKSSVDKSSLLEVINEERRRASFPDKKVTLTATSLVPPNKPLSFCKAQSCTEVVQMGLDKLVSKNVEPAEEKEVERLYAKNVKRLEFRRWSSKLDKLSCREVPGINIIPTSSTTLNVSIAPQELVEEKVDICSRPRKLKRNNSVNLKIQEQQLLQKRRRASNNQLPTFASHAPATMQHQPVFQQLSFPQQPLIPLPQPPPQQPNSIAQQPLQNQQLVSPEKVRRHSFIVKKLSQIFRSRDQLSLFQDKIPPQCNTPQHIEFPFGNHTCNLPIIKIQMSDDDGVTTPPSPSTPKRELFDSQGTEII